MPFPCSFPAVSGRGDSITGSGFSFLRCCVGGEWNLLASKPLTRARHEAASARDKVLLSPPHLMGPCVSPSHVPGAVIAAISCRARVPHLWQRQPPPGIPTGAALSGCPQALCLLQTGKLGQEVRHFPEDYVPWQFKNVGAHLSISVTN